MSQDYVKPHDRITMIKAKDVERKRAMRLYRASPDRWELQLRAPIGLGFSGLGGDGKDFIVASASCSIDELIGFRDAVNVQIEAAIRAPRVDADGVCEDCEKMPEGRDGRSEWCAYHRTHPTVPTVKNPLRQVIARTETAQQPGLVHEAVVFYRQMQIVDGEARLVQYVVTRQRAVTPEPGAPLRWYDSSGHYYRASDPNAYKRAIAMYTSVSDSLLLEYQDEAILDDVVAFVEEP